jgi:glucan phosphoethanolaminetransferase (alkaline phosphatase superfamily)
MDCFFIGIYSIENAEGIQHFGIFYNIIYVVFNVVVALLSLIIIFLYKNRNLQLRLSGLNMLLICIFIAVIFYFADYAKAASAGSIVHYGIGCYVPLIQLIFTFLAMRAIKKDEQLVRSADRLR